MSKWRRALLSLRVTDVSICLAPDPAYRFSGEEKDRTLILRSNSRSLYDFNHMNFLASQVYIFTFFVSFFFPT